MRVTNVVNHIGSTLTPKTAVGNLRLMTDLNLLPEPFGVGENINSGIIPNTVSVITANDHKSHRHIASR